MYIFMHMYIYTDRWIHTNTQYTQTCIQGHAYRHTIKNISMDMKGTHTLHRCRVYAGKPKIAQARAPHTDTNKQRSPTGISLDKRHGVHLDFHFSSA